MLLAWSLLFLTAAVQQPAAAKPAQSPARAAEPVTAFVNVSVIPMDREQVLAGQTVLVRGSKIAEVGAAAQVRVPAGATRIDGQGKFLLPGLGDMHVHFFPPQDEDNPNPTFPEWYATPRLACYAANGVTAIRVMAYDRLAAALPQIAAAAKLPSPRVYVAGSPDFFDGSTLDKFTALRTAGFHFALIYDNMGTIGLIDTFATAARQVGLRIVGDVPGDVGIHGALRAPYASIEQLHGYIEPLVLAKSDGYRLLTLTLDSLFRNVTGTPRVDQAKMTALAAETQKAGVWNVPSQAEAERMVKLWSGTEAVQTSLVLKIRRDMIKALHDAGAGLLLGTDAPAWGSDYGTGVHEELEALVASGLTPYQALEAGTRNVAQFLGTLDSTGTVTVGKQADLALLSANPIENIRNSAQTVGVMINGKWLPRSKAEADLKAGDCSGR